MAGTLTVTQAYSGIPVTLDTARIRSIDEFAVPSDAFGIPRHSDAGYPGRDFPAGRIGYQAPATETSPARMENYYTLQSRVEIMAALDNGVADLHSDPARMTRIRDYLIDLRASGVQEVPVHVVFGTPEALPGTWRTGAIENLPVSRLIANLGAGRVLAAAPETLDDFRFSQGRVMRKADQSSDPTI